MDRRRSIAAWTPLLFLLILDKGHRHGVYAKPGNNLIRRLEYCAYNTINYKNNSYMFLYNAICDALSVLYDEIALSYAKKFICEIKKIES